MYALAIPQEIRDMEQHQGRIDRYQFQMHISRLTLDER